MRGVTRRCDVDAQTRRISTRTPHAGSDDAPFSRCDDCFISTRTPHAGSDVSSRLYLALAALFQPALPMRGVTQRIARREIRDAISTRTPHAGSDQASLRGCERGLFQPALPMRGVTIVLHVLSVGQRISTRTPHAGSDPDAEHLRQGCAISTRTPHAGSDHHVRGPPSACRKFQPALPMRGVTRTDRDRGETPRFQPALPMRGVTCPSRNNPCQRR